MRSSVSLGDNFLHLLILLSAVVFGTEPVRGLPVQDELKACDFDTEVKFHSISDLLRCTDDLATTSPSGSAEQLKRIVERLEPEGKSFSSSQGRQGPGFYDYPYRQRPGRPIDPEEYPPDTGFYGPGELTGYPGLYGPSGPSSPSLIEALTSISQYDDLKCVPRLLCEIATGSKPGNGDYKASTLEDFGKNTLFGLLTASNLEQTSPLLRFGKAALLGYTSKGDPSICYQEYVRCPRDPRDLVHYLNNHNGGFFRFFKNAGRRTVAEGSNRAGYARKYPAPPPGLSGPESDRTGTGKLLLEDPEPTPRQSDEESVHLKRKDTSSKIVFPENESAEENQPPFNRVSKSLQFDVSSGFFPATTNDDSGVVEPPFFPLEDDDLERNNVVFESDENLVEQELDLKYRKGRLFNPDGENYSTSSFVKFPDDGQIYSFDSDVLKPFAERRSRALRTS